ncbi:FAD-dependent thymidylate synthase [Patescibacteria group bacterium]|nr:FAD-dependent thymidylate synthase [Patescibacteria group bacterium]
MKRVTPAVFLIAETTINTVGLEGYLQATENNEFLETIAEARENGLGDQEVLSSFFAKLCYKSLTLGKNQNVQKLRTIRNNIISTIESTHGSVFEHAGFSFVFHNVSRILTHELVRSRIGVAYSQESGRYCQIPKIGPGMYLPSCIAENPEAVAIFEDSVDSINIKVQELYDLFGINDQNFTEKKALTSAIRRIAPNGMANEIGFSANLRSLRYIINMRTSRHAEEEIRFVFAKVADIIFDRCPLLFCDGEKTAHNGITEWKLPHI